MAKLKEFARVAGCSLAALVIGAGLGFAAGQLDAHYDRFNGPIDAVASAIGNQTSALTLPATTTAYGAGQLIASSATAGSVVVPSFTLPSYNSTGYAPRMRLSTSDITSTAWGGVGVQIDLWSAAPTFVNGDRGTWSVASGAKTHLATYQCTMSAEGGDGAYAECAPTVAAPPGFALTSAGTTTPIYWTLQTISASGVTGANGVFTLTPEITE